MLFMFGAVLALKFGLCTEEFKFEIKTVTAGQNVTLSCPHQTSVLYRETFYWIRLVSGNWPEFLGATFNFMDDDVSKIPHIQTKQDGGEFLLHINEAKRTDTGLYYCIKVKQLDFIFMNGTFLKIKGPESDISAIIQEPSSRPVHPKDPETLQCSILSDSEESTCLTENRVYWFRAGPDHSHPSLLYLQGDKQDECKTSSKAPIAQKCFYNFSETFDAGTYYCAVAACGQILFGNGTKSEGSNSQKFPSIFLTALCSALVICLVVISWLTFKIKKKKCGCCNGPARNTGQQREENSLIYSAPMFNKAKKGERRNVKTAQEETVYTDIKTFR